MQRAILACLLSLYFTQAEARSYTCGLVMRQLTGGKYGREFNIARTWLKLPRTFARPGAVVVSWREGKALGGSPGGHVVLIRQLLDDCRAIVSDNRGTYQRNICKRQLGIVQP